MTNTADAVVRALEPERSLLLLVGRDPALPGAFTWAWGLYPEDAEHTRLVTRLRWRVPSAAGRAMMDAVEIWMMRKHLLGIKQRVEGPAGRAVRGLGVEDGDLSLAGRPGMAARWGGASRRGGAVR